VGGDRNTCWQWKTARGEKADHIDRGDSTSYKTVYRRDHPVKPDDHVGAMSQIGTRREVVVTAERGKRWWTLVSNEAHAVGQVHHLGKADAEMREMIAEALGVEHDAFDIRLEIVSALQDQQTVEYADQMPGRTEQATSEVGSHTVHKHR